MKMTSELPNKQRMKIIDAIGMATSGFKSPSQPMIDSVFMTDDSVSMLFSSNVTSLVTSLKSLLVFSSKTKNAAY